MWKTSGGAMGMAPLDSLPQYLKEKCGYDPVLAAQADAADKEQKRRQKELLAQQQQAGQSADTDITSTIRAAAEKEWPGDYAMQKYEIERQTGAYNWMVSATMAAGVPQETFNQIKNSAINEWPGNYPMQKYEINRQVKAYTALH